MTTDASEPAPAVVIAADVTRRAQIAWSVAVVVVAVGYAVLRLTMNEEYRPASWARLMEFRAPLPFGHRVLVPILARPFVEAGASIRLVFGGFESLAAAALCGAVTWTLRPRVGLRLAMVAGVSIMFVLPLLYLLPHRWPIFYPWDTPAMTLIVLGIGAIDRQRWGMALGLTAVAALNRESAVLLPVAALLLAPPREDSAREAIARIAGLLAAVLVVRVAIAVALPDNPGPALHFTVEGEYRVLHNLRWLRDPAHVLGTLVGLGLWPVLWPLLASQVDARWRSMWLLAWAQVAGLMIVANIYEPRAFGEALALAYLPSVVGVARWLGLTPVPSEDSETRPRWLLLLDRYGLGLLAIGFVGFVWALGRFAFLPGA